MSGGGGKAKGVIAKVAGFGRDALHSVAYARIVDLVSEGPVLGLSDQTNPLTCIFYNETPLQNADGSLNFQNVQVDSRIGTQDQDYIKGFGGVENEIAVAIELTQALAWSKSLTNLNLSAVRLRLSTPSLSKTNTETGDMLGTTVEYAIDIATDGGPFVEVYSGALVGKSMNKYERSHRVDLPAATTGWTIRMRRVTADSIDPALQNRTFIESYTEIIDAKLRYPNSAVVATQIDAAQFQSIPARAFDMCGRIIQVPSNYDPDTRVYTGIWDGTFQSVYSNNPAWVFRDLVTHTRYGLGHLVPPELVNKWALYKIARYCDELVPDGLGGTEPRFTCNVYLQTRADAYKVLQDLASVFRGMSYWGAGAINLVADMPEDPVYTYTAANVVDGKFSYSGSGRRARHTVALVSWNDMADFCRQKIEYVEDQPGIARYGIQSTDVISFGCTSRGQARRAGLWTLTTERMETDAITFGVGLDGTLAAPGQIVRIADENRAGKRIGGRVSGASISGIIVDAMPDPAPAPGDLVTVILPSGTAQTRTIGTVDPGTRGINPTVDFDTVPMRGSVWVIESTVLSALRARVLSVTQADAGYSITAMEHEPEKFDFIDFGDPMEPMPTSGNILPAAPASVDVTQFVRLGAEGGFTVLFADWEPSANATTYDVQWQKDGGNWSPITRTADSSFELENAFEGDYVFRVWAVNPQGFTSATTTSALITALPPVLPTKDLAIIAGIVTFDCRYSSFRLLLDANVTGVIFEHVAAHDTILIEITQGGAGGNTITFGASVVPVTGIPYVPSAAVGAVDMVGLTTANAGATWRLAMLQPEAGEGGTGGAPSVSVSPNPASATVAGDGVTPVAVSVALTAAVVGGTAPVVLAWSRADTGGTSYAIDDAASATPTLSIPADVTAYGATQQWRVVATDGATPPLTAQAVVPVTLTRTSPASELAANDVSEFEVTTPGTPVVAQGSSTAVPNFGTGPYTYAWTKVSGTGAPLFSGATSATAIFRATGTFVQINCTYRVTATDSLGATRTHDIAVIIEIEDGR